MSKYARPEYERRFLLPAPLGDQPARVVEIADRYLTGTTLRLRRMRRLDAPAPDVLKLTQKTRTGGDGGLMLTTIYLSEHEYDVLSALPAAPLAKTRRSHPPFGVDTFTGALEGLVLAEAEFDDAEACRTLRVPEFAVAEVTDDERFTGGRLATTSRHELDDLLRTFGVIAREETAAWE